MKSSISYEVQIWLGPGCSSTSPDLIRRDWTVRAAARKLYHVVGEEIRDLMWLVRLLIRVGSLLAQDIRVFWVMGCARVQASPQS